MSYNNIEIVPSISRRINGPLFWTSSSICHKTLPFEFANPGEYPCCGSRRANLRELREATSIVPRQSCSEKCEKGWGGGGRAMEDVGRRPWSSQKRSQCFPASVLTWISGPKTSAYLLRQGMDGKGCNGWKQKIRWWEMKMPLTVYNASAETTKWRFRKSKSRRGCERPCIDSRDGSAPPLFTSCTKNPGTPMSNFHA